MTVKVVKFPGEVKEYEIEEGTLVRDLPIDYSVEGYQVKVNGSTASFDAVVFDGDKVVFTKQIKGNE